MLLNESRLVAFEKVKEAKLTITMHDFLDNLDLLPIKTSMYNWLRNAKEVKVVEDKKV